MKQGQISQLASILFLVLIVVGAFVFILPVRGDIDLLKVQRDEAAFTLQTLQSDYDRLSLLAEEVAGSEAARDECNKCGHRIKNKTAEDDNEAIILELSKRPI
jgi:outer membrane murein-binding lipoprotein Lpp